MSDMLSVPIGDLSFVESRVIADDISHDTAMKWFLVCWRTYWIVTFSLLPRSAIRNVHEHGRKALEYSECLLRRVWCILTTAAMRSSIYAHYSSEEKQKERLNREARVDNQKSEVKMAK